MDRRVGTVFGLLLWVAAAGCGGRTDRSAGGATAAGGDEAAPPQAASTAPGGAAGAQARPPAGVAWEDPEPAGVQALAEEVVAAPWN